MPSKSKKQRRFMAAAAHNPAFAKRAGIKQSVAREFSEADQRTRRAKGGLTRAGYKLGAAGDRLLQRLEDAGLEEDDAIILPPLAAAAGAEAYAASDLYERRRRRKKDEAKRQKFAEGGKSVGKTGGGGFSQFLDHLGHGYRTQWMGQDEDGIARSAIYHDWNAPQEEWEWNGEAGQYLPPARTVRPGIVDETLSLPTLVGLGPDASFEAADRVQELDTTLRDQFDVDDPNSWPDYLAEAAGVMGAQLPVPGGSTKKAGTGVLSKLGKIPGAVAEWFMPTITPTPSNYLTGTAAGAVLTKYLPELMGEEEDLSGIDFTDPDLPGAIQSALEQGELSMEAAESLFRQVADATGNLEPTDYLWGQTEMAKGGRIYTGRPPLLSLEQLKIAHEMYSDGQSIAQIADELRIPYARLYKRMTRAGLAPVTPPSKRTELTPEERLDALQRHLAGEPGRAVAEDVGVAQSDIAHLKRRNTEIEGHAKGGKIRKFDGLLGRIHQKRMRLTEDILRKLQDGTMTDAEFEANDRESKRLADLMYKLEDTEEANELAKGGKVPPVHPKMALRQKLEQIMREAESPSLMPEEPFTPSYEDKVNAFVDQINPVTTGTRQSLTDRLMAPDTEYDRQVREGFERAYREAEQGASVEPKTPLLETPVTRRDVLHGMTSLASPIDTSIDLSNLPELVDAAGSGAAKALEPVMGIVARVNDGEGYERAAWGATPSAAWRNLINHLAEGLDDGSSEFESLQQAIDMTDEFGINYQKAPDTINTDWQNTDPVEDAMVWIRGEENYRNHNGIPIPDDFHDEFIRTQFADGYSPEEAEELFQSVKKRIEDERQNEMLYDPEGMDVSPRVQEVFDELEAQPGGIDAMEGVSPEMMRSRFPDLSWGEIAELGWMLDGSLRTKP